MRFGRPVSQPYLRWHSLVLQAGLGLLGALTTSGCDADYPERDCISRVWVPAGQDDTTVVASWLGWVSPGVPLESFDEQWRVARFLLPPGEHGYLLERSGAYELDPFNPLSTWEGEAEVSLLLVEDCTVPTLDVAGVTAGANGEILVNASFAAAAYGEPLAPESVHATLANGTALALESADPDTGQIVLRSSAQPRGRHHLVVDAADKEGNRTAPARAVAWVEPAHESWRDGVLYQVMVDRFRADDGSPLAAPPTPGSRAGGTLAGVQAALEQGMFEELGVTALWLSPVYQNPVEAREGRDGRLYEGYHGYWPLESRTVEPRLGGEAALDAFVSAAHARGLAVVLDLVPNHVYEQNPRYLAHQNDGWFNRSDCVCGASDCPWSEYMLTCWFTSYLPDVHFQNRDSLGATLEDALFWTERFDLDGARIDAVPMMPRGATRRMAHTLRTAKAPREASFLLGEVYTGPGDGGTEQLRLYLGADTLDSVFDFPLMWSLHDTLARGGSDFEVVEHVLAYTEERLAGSGAVLGLILDNHDTPRFVSVARGDAWGDPWTSPAVQPTDDAPYDRLAMALSVTFTLPGLPVLFQGDELGLAGAGDPDCRRVMPADDELLPAQQAVRERVRQLSSLRRCSTALRRGGRQALVVLPSHYAYVRGSAEPFPALVVVANEEDASEVLLPADAVGSGEWIDVLSGEPVGVSEGLPTTVAMAPLSVRILLRADDPCL